MKISAKTEYACVAMLELAARFDSAEPVRIRDIAQQHGIPSRFLVQILLQLKGAGLVASTRGAAGGYQLVHPPGEVTLGTVMAVIDGQEEKLTSSAGRRSPMVDILQKTWQQVADVEHEMLDSVNFAELLERARTKAESMYYI